MVQLLGMPIYNVLEGLYDACRDSVTPKLGSVVYCDLAFGYMEHSGIYIGNNQIVHLNGDGLIESVSPKEFMEGTTACSIYVSSLGEHSTGSKNSAQRAINMIGRSREYNFLMDNCHQFSAGCLTGDFNDSINFLWMLKHCAGQELNADNWRYWDL